MYIQHCDYTHIKYLLPTYLFQWNSTEEGLYGNRCEIFPDNSSKQNCHHPGQRKLPLVSNTFSRCYVIWPYHLPASPHTSLGTNSSMFVNCFFCDVWHVRSLVLDQNVMFISVRSLVLLLCDQTSLGTYSLMFVISSVFCDVRHIRSSILGQNVMFRMFNVQTINVRCVRSSVFWCSFQD